MSAHAPGPWSWMATGSSLWSGDTCVLGVASPSLSKDVVDDPDDYWIPTEADARLIAAAPELLEALTDLSSWVNRAIVTEYTTRKPMPESCRKALEASAAAIAKATGDAT